MPVKIPSQIENAIAEMPSISPIVHKLTDIAHDLETAPKDLVKIIMIDPVLTGKVIQLVNSAFYGLSERVNSLAQAVVLLGVNTVKNLVLCTAVLDRVFLKTKGVPLNSDAFWRHCLSIAIASRSIAKSLNIPNTELEIYFLAGLLHDLGKVIYLKAVPDAYRMILADCQRLEVSLHFAEMSYFGFAHTHIGGVLARKWKLDPLLIAAIENHHLACPSEIPKAPANVVFIANNLCKRAKLGEAGNPVSEEAVDDLVSQLEISPASLHAIVQQLPSELERAADFLKLARMEATA